VRSPWPSLVISLAAVLGCHVADPNDDDPGTGGPMAYGGPVSEWPNGNPVGAVDAGASASEAPQTSGTATSAGSGGATNVADAGTQGVAVTAHDAGAPPSGPGDTGLVLAPMDAQVDDAGCPTDADAGPDAAAGDGACGDAIVNCILSFGSACNPP
jgi:hypothetical protein